MWQTLKGLDPSLQSLDLRASAEDLANFFSTSAYSLDDFSAALEDLNKKLQNLVANDDGNGVLLSCGAKSNPGVSRQKEPNMQITTNVTSSALKPVSFTVEKIEKANKKDCIVATIKFNGSDKVYTYVRKYRKDGWYNPTYSFTVDGCDVLFKEIDGEYKVLDVYRVYNTKGVKKLSTANFGGKAAEDTAETAETVEPVAVEPVISNTVFPLVNLNEPVKHGKYDTIKTCLQCGIPVYLAGPAGSGKNFTVEQIAKEMGWDFYFSNSVQQEFKLTGFVDAAGDFHETEFYKACTSEKDCVFFLDEMDASIPEVLVLLNAAIANGYFEFPTGRVDLKNVHFVAAGNTVGSGSDEMYTGRMVIDQATLDRFAIIEFGYDTNIEMAMAENDGDLVDFIHSLRKSAESQGVRATFSYRCITMAKKLENAGMPLVEVIKIAVVKGLDADTVHTLFVKTVNADNRFAKAFSKVKYAA